MASTTQFYIIGPFFFLKTFSCLSSSFVWHGRTLFPTVICTYNFGPLFCIIFNFSTWGGRGGEVSDHPPGNRNGCMHHLYQEKISSGYIFHPPPNIMFYICQDTLDVSITSESGLHTYCPTTFVTSVILILSIDKICAFKGINIIYTYGNCGL